MKIKYFTRGDGVARLATARITTNLHYLMDTAREDLSKSLLICRQVVCFDCFYGNLWRVLLNFIKSAVVMKVIEVI